MSDQKDAGSPRKEKPIKPLWIIAGSILLIAGFVGSFIPIIPGTLLIIISLTCFARGSTKIYHWLLNNKLFGQRLRNILGGKGLSLKEKLVSVFLISLSGGLSIYFASLLAIKIWIAVITLPILIYIIYQPTLKK